MNVNRKMAIVTEINDSEKTCEGWFIYATEKRRRGEEETAGQETWCNFDMNFHPNRPCCIFA